MLRALQQMGTVEVMILGDEYEKRERVSQQDIGPEKLFLGVEVQPKLNRGAD